MLGIASLDPTYHENTGDCVDTISPYVPQVID